MPEGYELDDDGCRKPSKYLPITMEFFAFQSRANQIAKDIGVSSQDVMKLARMLADKQLEGRGDGA